MFRKNNLSNLKAKKILMKRFNPIPDVIAERGDLTSGQKSVYGAMLRFVNKTTGRIFPRKKLIASRTGLSVKAVETSLKRFKHLGLITWETNFGSSNTYSLHIPDDMLAELEKREKNLKKSTKITSGKALESEFTYSYRADQDSNKETKSISFISTENEDDEDVKESIARLNIELQDIPESLRRPIVSYSENYLNYFPGKPLPIWDRFTLRELEYFVNSNTDKNFVIFLIEWVFENWLDLAYKWEFSKKEVPTISIIIGYTRSMRTYLWDVYKGIIEENEEDYHSELRTGLRNE